MPQWIQDFWQFLKNNKDPIDALVALVSLASLMALFRVLSWVVNRWWRKRLRTEIKAFEFIYDSKILLPKLYNEEGLDNPLAHHRIPYEPRDPSRDIQAELRSALNKTRYLLIKAPSGIGKTREAATLAQSLMEEGYRVVRITTGWLDVPKEFPAELNNDRRHLLILLDDLNGLFRTGEFIQSPKAEQIPLYTPPSFHDRLLAVFDAFEEMCGASEVRIIATARDEENEWKQLNIKPNDNLWKRFHFYELPAPSDTAIIELLTNATAQSTPQTARSDFSLIARKNDGTYANVILNLQRLQRNNSPLTIETYTPTLNGSWQESYERALQRHSAISHIYDAIDILSQIRVDLYIWLVGPTAELLWNGNWLQRLTRRNKISRALAYLTNERIIARSGEKLVPRDGQIEAKGNQKEWKAYMTPLSQIILRLANNNPNLILDSLSRYAATLYNDKFFNEAKIIYAKGSELSPQDGRFWSGLGVSLYRLDKIPEAETAFRRAVECDQYKAVAYTNLANLLSKRKQYSESEDAHRKAIESDPNYFVSYYNFGNFLHDVERYDEAIEAYQQALKHNPGFMPAFSNLVTVKRRIEDIAESEDIERCNRGLEPKNPATYYKFGRILINLDVYEKAEKFLRRAIEQDPNHIDAYKDLGFALVRLGRVKESEEMYQKALEINPGDIESQEYIVSILCMQQRFEEALTIAKRAIQLEPESYTIHIGLAFIYKKLADVTASAKHIDKARVLISSEDFYNLACLETVSGNHDSALENLKKRANQSFFDVEWAKRDPTLECIRHSQRFIEVIESTE